MVVYKLCQSVEKGLLIFGIAAVCNIKLSDLGIEHALEHIIYIAEIIVKCIPFVMPQSFTTSFTVTLFIGFSAPSRNTESIIAF